MAEFLHRKFGVPFAYVISDRCIETHCAHCLTKSAMGNLLKCPNCSIYRYCNDQCMVNAKPVHEFECRLLVKGKVTRPPLTEILLFIRIYAKLLAFKSRGDKIVPTPDVVALVKHKGETIRRNFDSLLTHRDEIMNDADKRSYFNAYCVLFSQVIKIDPDIPFPESKLMEDMFCKKLINTYQISDNRGNMTGEALDLGASAYDHSCRPSIGVLYEGYKVIYRALESDIDINDTNQAFVSYCELAASKYIRRCELKEKYYFECQCSRCINPNDDWLTSMLCTNPDCSEPMVVTEVSTPSDSFCIKCSSPILKEQILAGQQLMKRLATMDQDDQISTERYFECLRTEIKEAQAVLYPMNIYLCDLYTAFAMKAVQKKTNADEAYLYSKLALPCLRWCYPSMQKNLAFHLLKIVYLAMLSDRRNIAAKYSLEVVEIFTCWFGKDHVYTRRVKDFMLCLSDAPNENIDNMLAFLVF